MVRWSVVLILLLIGSYLSIDTTSAKERLIVHDVGQGDAITIDGTVPVLVDTGSRGALANRDNKIPPGIVIISHLHEDHMGDIRAALAGTPVAVFWNGRQEGSMYTRLVEEATRAHVPLLPLYTGDRLRIGETLLEVIGPSPAYLTSGDPNDTSLVIRVDTPTFSALLTGDSTSEVEKTLPYEKLDVDVLKVGHHGSRGSTSEYLLEATTPKVALISAGQDNKYGHPHEEIMTRLEQRGIRTHVTTHEGDSTWPD